MATILPLAWLIMSRISECFFFSSRRRHTRYIGDWSSDVCSSDLSSSNRPCPISGQWLAADIGQGRLELEGCDISGRSFTCIDIHSGADPLLRRNRVHGGRVGIFVRSEERRVGKECVVRWIVWVVS